ncbi:MAG: Lrp/AsnC family transcriptional regulator, partial [Syntrophomonadaceae bacterium]
IMLTDTDIQIIQYLQGDIPLESSPYTPLADRLGISEEQIVQRIQWLHDQGLIRRLAAVLRHREAGFTVNAMVAWQVDADKADKVGTFFAGDAHVSHCYWRQVPEDFPYNLFTMIHARSPEELQERLERLSHYRDVKDYVVLESLQEYKKTSMKFF